MHRRHRVVNFVSLLAIVVGMFSPVLSLPVLAQEPPDVATPVIETPVTLTPVVPELPGISEAACGDGVAFAQVATAAETEGVSYTIGEPDAEGVFTVTATLIDTELYRWADSGLDGWTVVDNTATSTGTLALCPIPEPEEPGGSGEGDDNGSEISTPVARANSNSMSPSDVDGALLTHTITADKSTANNGDEITFTVTVENIGTADAGAYQFQTDLAIGEGFLVHTEPREITTPDDGITCENGAPYTLLNCHNLAASPVALSPGDTHVYTAVVVVSALGCEGVYSRGGAHDTELWAEGSLYPGDAQNLVTVNCDSGLTLESGTSTDGEVNEGEAFNYTVTVENTSTNDSGAYEFTTQLPAGLELVEQIVPVDASCDPVTANGFTTITCEGPGITADDEPYQYIFSVRANSELNADICDEPIDILTSGTSDNWGEQSSSSTSVTVTCASPSLTIEIEADTPTITHPDERMAFTITVSNTSSNPVSGLTVFGSMPLAFAADDWNVTDTDGTADCVIQVVGEAEGTLAFCEGMTVPAQVGDVPGTLTVNYSLAEGVTYPEGVCGPHQVLAGMQHPSLDEDSVLANSSVTIDCEPTLVQSVTADRTAVVPGGLVEYTISVTNTSNWDFSYTDENGAGQTFLLFLANADHGEFVTDYVSSIPNTDCQVESFVNEGFTGFICYFEQGAEVEAMTTETVTVSLRAPAEPSEALCASGIETQLADTNEPGVYEPGPAVALDCGELLLTKSDNVGSSIGVGEEFEYGVTVTNNGINAAGGYSFTDPLPAGIELADANPITAPDGATCTPATSGGVTTITCESDTAPNVEGETHDYTFSVTSNYELDADVCGDITNTVTGTTGAWGEQDSASTAVTVECTPRFELEFEADQTEVEVGDTINYIATVTNTGTAEDGYVFRANISGNATLLQDPPVVTSGGMSCEPDGAVIDCRAQNMSPDEVHTLTYSVLVTPENFGSTCNPIGAMIGYYSDYWLDDDDERQYAEVDQLCPVLSIDLTDNVADGESVGLNEPFTYTITLTNTGDSEKGDFSFLSYFPESVVLAPDSVLDSRCESASQFGSTFVSCSGTTIPLGQGNGLTFEVDVIAVDSVETPACGTVSAEAQITRGVWVEGQQGAEESTDIECVSSVNYSIEPLVSPVVPGESIGFEFIVHNTGNTRITEFSSSNDLLPDLPDGAEWTTTLTLNGEPISLDEFPSELVPGDILKLTIESGAIPPDLTVPENEWCKAWTMSSTLIAGFTWGEHQEIPAAGTVQVNCTGLSITQDVSSDRIQPGGEVEYTITVTNHGNTTVSPMQVFHDSSETGTVFSNWNVTNDTALECGLAQNDDPGCTYLTLAPQESVVITITGDAPADPTEEQCAPATSRAMVVYGDVLTMARASVGITPPYTPLYSEPVTTQLECQSGVDISSTAVVNTGDDGRVDAGDTVTFTIAVENTGIVSLYDLTISHDLAGVVWDDDLFIDELGPADTFTITGTYTVTQEDIDAGEIVTTMSVEGGVVAAIEAARVVTFGFAQPADDESGDVSASITETFELTQEPGVQLEVSSVANTGDDDELNPGDSIDYTFTVTNTGNVTLTDLDIGSGTDGLTFADGTSIASLAPGDEAVLTASYAITQADVDAGMVEMCADAVATDPNNAPVNASDVCDTIDVAQPVPATPTPSPDPATPEPTTPATPDSSATPVPTEEGDAESVTGLPETGFGPGVMTPILWVAATLGVVALGIGGVGVRRSRG